MATKVGPTNLPAFFSSSADFQAWVTAIHNALSTLGFVQTTDTGQINPGTVTLPSSNGIGGYEIWRFADTLQSSVPVFFKIEYAIGSSAGQPNMWFTVGSGSNGSGTLTGQVGQRQQVGTGSLKSAGVTLPAWFCSDGSDLQVAYNIDSGSSSYGAIFCISRPRDQSGAATAEGAVWFTSTSNVNNVAIQFIPAAGSVPAVISGSTPAINPAYLNRSIAGPDALVCPVMLPLVGNWRYLRFLMIGQNDFGAAGATFTATVFGASHTFVTLGACAGSTAAAPPGNGAIPGFALAFE